MFKNPLKKYAIGGVTSSAEQQAEDDFASVIAEQLKVSVEQVKTRLNQIKSNPEESKKLQSALQLMQQDQRTGFQKVLELFTVQSAKNGGKIHDFICKHAKGGMVDCGCGGSVQKGQNGLQKVGRGLRAVMRTTPIGKYLLAPEKSEGYRDAEWGAHSLPNLEGITDRRGGVGRDINGNPVYYLGEVVNGTSADSYYFPNTGIIEQHIAGNPDQIKKTYNPGSYEYETVYGRMKPLMEQRGDKIPSMTYISLGDIEGNSSRLGDNATFTPVIGERAIIDGKDVFIPNRQTSGSMMWGRNNQRVLEPSYGYADEGQTVYTPWQIAARKKVGMIDTAHANNENKLVGYQEGGEIQYTGTQTSIPLTRKQARLLSQQNKGLNRSQFQTAMVNADNMGREAGLRGKELRNWKRNIVAGISGQEKELIPSPTFYRPDIIIGSPEQLSMSKSVVKPQNENADLGSLPFAEAFRNARQAGNKTFTWNGKLYNTMTKEEAAASKSTPTIVLPDLGIPEIETVSLPEVLPGERLKINNAVPKIVIPVKDSTETVEVPIDTVVVPADTTRTAKRFNVSANENKSDNTDHVAEYLKTHYPNGQKRNFITRLFTPYVKRENPNTEDSALFIGPESPAHRVARERYEASLNKK